MLPRYILPRFAPSTIRAKDDLSLLKKENFPPPQVSHHSYFNNKRKEDPIC